MKTVQKFRAVGREESHNRQHVDQKLPSKKLKVGHNRRSIRLKGYDYSSAGAYFVTICTQNRAPLFGSFVDGTLRLSAAGEMVLSIWNEIPHYYPGVEIDAFVVMPDHVHGIIWLCPMPAPPAELADSPRERSPMPETPGCVGGAAPRGRPNPAPKMAESPRERSPMPETSGCVGGAASRGRPNPIREPWQSGQRGKRGESGQRGKRGESGQPGRCGEFGQPRGVAPASDPGEFGRRGEFGQPRGAAPASYPGDLGGLPSESGRPRGVALYADDLGGSAWEPGRSSGGTALADHTLPGVVQRFKSLTTTRYIDGVHAHGWRPFPGRLWQRNYFERIIRDDAALIRIREYIHNNPSKAGAKFNEITGMVLDSAYEVEISAVVSSSKQPLDPLSSGS